IGTSWAEPWWKTTCWRLSWRTEEFSWLRSLVQASRALRAEGVREQRRRGADVGDPELVGGAGHRDVEQSASVVGDRIRRVRRVEQDDNVELQALRLAHVGDVDAGREREVLVGDQAQRRHLGAHQRL